MSMKQQFSKLRGFYRSDFLHWLSITAASFLILVMLSFVIGLFVPSLASNVASWFAQGVDELGVVDEQGNFDAIALFFNNSRSMVAGILMGFIPYIYFTALSLGVNSMLLGFFAALYVDNGYPMVQYFAALFPHGLFELPAMVITFACGIYLCHTVTDYVRNNVKGTIKTALSNLLRVFFIQTVPLLLIAAFLEAYVTPRFLEFVMR